MLKILVLGAGRVSGPVVEELLSDDETLIEVLLCDLSEKNLLSIYEKIQKRLKKLRKIKEENSVKRLRLFKGDLLNGFKELKKKTTIITTNELVKKANVIISLLPPKFHSQVAAHAISAKKPLVTPSYKNEELILLDKEAKKQGVTIITECGLDPGLDQMNTARLLDKAKAKDQEIISYKSLCGGLPVNKEEPLFYKFNWHPVGVLKALTTSATYLENRMKKIVPGKELCSEETVGETRINRRKYEYYPNRDSITHLKEYMKEWPKELSKTETFIRATLRHKGFCERINLLKKIGLLKEQPTDAKNAKELLIKAVQEEIKELLTTDKTLDYLMTKAGSLTTETDDKEIITVIKELSDKKEEKKIRKKKSKKILEKKIQKRTIKKVLTGLGFFTKEPLRGSTFLELTADLLSKNMLYKKGEEDEAILKHEIIKKDKKKGELIREESTLIVRGKESSNTWSAMAITVGLPVALIAKELLKGYSKPGIIIPLYKELYEPVLNQLSKKGIGFKENNKVLKRTRTRTKKRTSNEEKKKEKKRYEK